MAPSATRTPEAGAPAAVRARLDLAATTPMRSEAAVAMTPYLAEIFANPSGGHASARAAKTALEEAREGVATALGARPHEVVFTGSGTEADNLALKGAARAARAGGRGEGVVVSAFEHKAVLASGDRLAREGFRVTRTGVSRAGVVDLDALADALDERTAVVSVMLVNNEVGTVQPLAEVAEVVRSEAPSAVLHTDAVQAVPWLDVAEAAACADLVAVSGHKFGGPKGVGALVVRDGVELEPLIEGGGQEEGRRAGTTNLAGVVGLAAALAATEADRAATVTRVEALRDRLRTELFAAIPGAVENGDPAGKVAGNLHLLIPGVDAESLLLLMDRAGVDAAAGSSCSSGATEPSYVLTAMGLTREEASSSIRLSLGHTSTEADVEIGARVIPAAVAQLREAAVSHPNAVVTGGSSR